MKKVINNCISVATSLVLLLFLFQCFSITKINASAEIEKAIEWAESISKNEKHGYSQSLRNGDPDYDCSSFVYYALKNAGIGIKNQNGQSLTYAFSTWSMHDCLPYSGFTYYPLDQIDVQRGDILYRSGHTEFYIGNNQTVGAHGDEPTDYAPYRSIEPGDQGDEISTCSYNSKDWSGVFRYSNDKDIPIGAVDIIESTETGTIRVAGWAYDLDDLSQAIELHMYVGGKAGSSSGHCYPLGVANHGSSDLVDNGISGDHRFDIKVSVSETGNQPVYIYALNIKSGNTNPLIGSGSIAIKTQEEKLPTGAVDLITAQSPGIIRVQGWAYDIDDLDTSLSVHVYVGGPANNWQAGEGRCYIIDANGASPDLNANGIKGNHRFDTLIEVSEVGKQDVYIYAINIGSGNHNPVIAKGSVDIESPIPFGAVDILESNDSGTIHVAGWTYDLDDLNQAIELHMYVGGRAGSNTGHCYVLGAADHESSDLIANGINGNHRFDTTVSVEENGEQEIFIYAINIKRGSYNPLIHSGVVNIINEPITTTTTTSTTTTTTTKPTTTSTNTTTTTKSPTTFTTTTEQIITTASKLSIEETSISLINGEQYTIKANQNGLTYSSNNKNVAVVSKEGVVTAIGEGEATISVINSESDVVQLKIKVEAISATTTTAKPTTMSTTSTTTTAKPTITSTTSTTTTAKPTTTSTTSTTTTSEPTTTSTTSSITSTTIASTFTLGDVTGDGIIDGRDATDVLTDYAKSSTGQESKYTEEQKKAADVNKDGILDGRDATAILTYYAKTSTGYSGTLEDYMESIK